MAEFRYRAFISYAHADKQWGEWLHRALETYRVPKKLVGRETKEGPVPRRLTPVFRDRDELAAADSLSTEIEAALKASRFLIVLASPRSAQSKWVNKEILRFKQLHGEGRILAAIIDGKPGAGGKDECFPEALRFRIGEDGQLTEEPTEPIAADFRKGGDGKKLARSKIVAGLLGLKLDDLIEREQIRRNQRMRVVAASMGAVAASFGVVAWDALRQRDNARLAEARAVEARGEAEGLVEYMLTDFYDELKADGRLNILEKPGRRALAYYDARDLSTATPDELGRRARAQLLVGEIDNLRGDLDAALASYTAAAKTTEEQLRRDPDNPDRIFDHSQSVFWVGYIAWQRGDADTARRYFTQYYEQANRLVEIDPDNEDYQFELMYAYSNLGSLEMDEGDATKAESYFRPSLDIALRLLEKHPNDPDIAIEAGQSYAWLEDALTRRLNFAEALQMRQAEVALYENALSSNPDHNGVLEQKIVAHDGARGLHLALNDLDAASLQAHQAVDLGSRLLDLEPESTRWMKNAALAYKGYGEVLFYQGSFDEAEKQMSMALQLGKSLLAQNASVLYWRLDYVAHTNLFLARIAYRTGDIENSERYIRRSVELTENIFKTSGNNQLARRRYASAIAASIEIDGQSEFHWDSVIAILSSQNTEAGPESLSLLATAYSKSGKNDKAKLVTAQLYEAGYRHPEFLTLLQTHPEIAPMPPTRKR